MRSLPTAVLLAGMMLNAQTLSELVDASRTAPLLKAAAARSAAAEAQHGAAEGGNYPSLDARFSGTYFKEQPVVYLQSSFAGVPPGTTLQTQSQQLYFGALKLTYPLFTGFAISAGIETAKIEAMKARLEEADARRNLYLRLVQTYAGAIAAEQLIRADDEALASMERSYAKAEGFYAKGLLTESDLLRIKADRIAVSAAGIRDRNRYETALQQLSYLSDTNVTSVAPLPYLKSPEPQNMIATALANRPDLKALKAELHLAREQERSAESGYYPTVALFGQLASQGDTWELNGDGYTNKDKSAAGFEVTYNLFSGNKTRHEREAARQAQLGAGWAVSAYEKQIRTDIRSSLLTADSLEGECDAARARVAAEEAYAAQVEGQFEAQLADADLLGRAIAALAKARSELAVAEARLYAVRAVLLLQVGPETFEAALKE